MKKRISKTKLVRNILLFTSLLLITLTTIILAKSDFSPQAFLHENIYLWLSTKRDTETFTTYKDINDVFVEVETLQSITDYTRRSAKAIEIRHKITKLESELDNIQKKYDDRLTSLEVSDALKDQAEEYKKVDTILNTHLAITKVYLDKEILINNYLLAKSNIITCYQSIPSKASQQSLTTINKCIKQNSLVKSPDIENLKESEKYQNQVGNYLQASYKLHNYLLNNDAQNAEKQRKIVVNKFETLIQQNQKSNQELEKQLVILYNNLLEFSDTTLPSKNY